MINFSEWRIAEGTPLHINQWNGLIDRVEQLPLSVSPDGTKVGVSVDDPQTTLHIGGPMMGHVNGGALRIESTFGKLDIGSQSADWAHFYTDREKFYFSKEIRVDSGKIGSYNEDLNLCTSGNSKVTVKTNGNVGIGTTAPTEALHVIGNRIRLQKTGTSKYVDIRTDGAANDITSYGADLYLAANGGGKIVVNDLLEVRSQLTLKNMPYGDFKNVQWNSSTGVLGYDNSSRRFKENITDLKVDFEAILKAKPKTYTRPGNPDRWEIGFIAEDFHDLGLKPLVDYDEENLPEGLGYEKMVTYLVPIIAKQKEQIESLQKEVSTLKQDILQLNTVD